MVNNERSGLTEKHQIYLVTNFNPDMNDVTRLFARDIIRMGTIKYQNHQLYYFAQAADFVPFPNELAADYVPHQVIDKSNAELWATYGLAIGDVIAPEDAFVDESIHALIGEPAVYAPKVRLANRKYTNQLENYRVRYWVYPEDADRYRDEVGIYNLIEGWNLFTFEVDGSLRTLFAFGDIIPPSFEPNEELPNVINPLDLSRGFRVTGTILDNSFGERNFRKSFNGKQLAELPVEMGIDGSQYVVLVFDVWDFARNSTTVYYTLFLDEEEPRAHVKVRKVLPKRIVTSALTNLLGFAA